MTRGPTTVMRDEHVDIKDRMQRAASALEAKNASAFRDALGELVAILSAHNMKEEKMLYPMTDRAIDTVEAQERFVTRLAKF